MNEYKVSVVIPMYNRADTIVRALDSIRKQTGLHYIKEIIIVNDGSTDNSINVTSDYANKYKELPISLINKDNGGVSSARNLGLKRAEGDYIALLDSDDEWLPEKITTQMDLFKMYPEIDFIGGNYNNLELKILFKKIDYFYKASLTDLCIKFFPQPSTAVFKRKIIGEIGFFDEGQKYAEDGNYFMKICDKFNYYHLPINLALCDGGKPSFGFSGLSANLKGMHKGNVKNIKELRMKSQISIGSYVFLRLFYFYEIRMTNNYYKNTS